VNPKLQGRVQRYGWDLAAEDYEPLWHRQLADARSALFSVASVTNGERVLDVACGTGLVAFEAARLVGAAGRVTGVDLSGKMVAAAQRRAADLGVANATFQRMDAQKLEFPEASFDVVVCALGLMYVPEPVAALSEMRRILRPGGRMIVAVWGERSQCGWAPLFEIVDAEVSSEVCPLFFNLGQQNVLADLCEKVDFDLLECRRLRSTLSYADADEACDAAFIGGPVALAWSRFAADTRQRVRKRYVSAIDPWRQESGYHIPGEFVVVAARRPLGFNSA
jgi:ubiquinone/menaquinone biosynthesis C-methylase UbiE